METDFRDQLSLSSRHDIGCSADTPVSRAEITYYVYDADGERARKITERKGKRLSERTYIGESEIYRTFNESTGDLDLERRSLHVSNDERRFALFETRTEGDDGTARQLIRSQFSNHLGSACLEVEYDKRARIISYEEYHPYGTTAYQATNRQIASAAKRYRFAGKERDEENGLSYHVARYFSPWLGRWVSSDPIVFTFGRDAISQYAPIPTNAFEGLGNSPINFSDPTGNEPERPELRQSKNNTSSIAKGNELGNNQNHLLVEQNSSTYSDQVRVNSELTNVSHPTIPEKNSRSTLSAGIGVTGTLALGLLLFGPGLGAKVGGSAAFSVSEDETAHISLKISGGGGLGVGSFIGVGVSREVGLTDSKPSSGYLESRSIDINYGAEVAGGISLSDDDSIGYGGMPSWRELMSRGTKPKGGVGLGAAVTGFKNYHYQETFDVTPVVRPIFAAEKKLKAATKSFNEASVRGYKKFEIEFLRWVMSGGY